MSTFGAAVRPDFPAVANDFVFLDAPGGTQMPTVVAAKIASTGVSPISNRSRGSLPGRNADDAVLEFRAAAADLLGADPAGIVQGRSATQLTFDFSRTISKTWAAGDNIVLSQADHDCNVAPWLIAAERAGVEVRWAKLDAATSELPAAQYEDLVDARTRLVAVTAASNLVGTQPDIAAISAIAHAQNALTYVDGVHYTAHAPVDVRDMGADFFVASPYKFFGPHFGMLAASPELLETLHPDKLRPSPETVPERFELGTLPYEMLAGATAAIDYVAGLSPAGGTRRERIVAAMLAMDEYELELRDAIERGLAEIPGVTCYSRAQRRTSTLLITVAGITPLTIEARLRERGFLAQAGHFYAVEVCNALGLGEQGGVRFGLAPYNTREEVDGLLIALAEAVAEG
ncbi:cysteine desulfurase-like protein [Leucobacter sp. G161]|uniref:cysteine desulfurase-like protein n=1 Tax=Leucobacter sp. G161 TaxID=663704 RepID=UPI00073CC564|nr:cysteine desulfurase-like protein [Leucobacter sp. G161]KUF06489.1 cysteine desulfurase [Leucobacter sp. G161]